MLYVMKFHTDTPWVLGAVPGVGFMMIALVLYLPSQFENCTFCRAGYLEILLFDKKLACLVNYQERRSFPCMASCSPYFRLPITFTQLKPI